MALTLWGKQKVNGNGHSKPEPDTEPDDKQLIARYKSRIDVYEHTIESLNAQLDEAKAEINRLNGLILKNMEFLHGTVEKLVLAKTPQGESPKAALSPTLQAYLDKKKTDNGPAKKLP